MEILKTSHTNLHEAINSAWEAEENDLHFTHFCTADNRLFRWNPYVAHKFAAHGMLSEETFCTMCEIPKELLKFITHHQN
jgi:hypothetical protein